MKPLLLITSFWVLATTPLPAQFPDFPEADLVLGATDFDSVGSAASNETGIDYPLGIAVDSLSGKVFVSCFLQHRILRYANINSLVNGAAAEAALGQPDLFSINPGTAINRLNQPNGIFLDNEGRLWVADVHNHRVVRFADAITAPTGADADLVLGQSSFNTNQSGVSAESMQYPANVFVDAHDSVWVCDYNNHRVLKFAAASTLSNGDPATIVIGQTTFGEGSNGTAANRLFHPSGVIVDAADHLWIADQFNHRVLRFDEASTIGTGANASGVLGQPDFTSGSPGTSAETLRTPSGLVMNAGGTLWVVDQVNHRIVSYQNAAQKAPGEAADGVIGQPDFDSGSPGLSSRRFNGPDFGIALDGAGRLWISDSQNDRVLRFSPTTPSIDPDVTGPNLTLTSKVPRRTTKSRLTITGRAADPSGIASVRYKIGSNGYARAKGTAAWRFTTKLKHGSNSIRIVAADLPGNLSSPILVRVTRN